MNIPEDPCDRLLDELDRRGWTQQKFAHIIGRPPQAVSEIVNGKKQITTVTALQFGAALHTPAEEWLELQANFNLYQLRQSSSVQSELAMIGDRVKRWAGPLLVEYAPGEE